MKRLLKLIALLAGLFACLIAAAAAAVRICLPPEKLKALVLATAGSKLHRTLEMQSVDFGLLSGLRIEGLRLSEAPDFSKGTFLSADTFELKPQWLPLLHKEIVARRIVLDGVSATVIQDKDGRFNFSDLLGARAAPVPAAAKPVSKPAAKAEVNIQSLAVDGFRMSGPFSLSLEAQVVYAAKGKTYSGAFKARGTVDLGGGDPAALKADLTSFSAGLDGKEAAGSLSFENAVSPKVSLALKTPELDDAFLNQAAGSALVPEGTRVPSISLKTAVAYDGSVATIQSLGVSLPGLSLEGSGSVRLPKNAPPVLDIALKAPDMDLGKLADILERTRGAGIGGKVSLDVSIKGPARGSMLRTSGAIAADTLTHPNFDCGKAALTWNLTGVTPDMKRLNGTAKLLAGAGRMTDILDFAGRKGGLVKAWVLPLQAVQKASGLIPGFNMDNIPFTKIEGDYAARDGVVTLRPSSLDGPVIAINTTGTADLVSQTANLRSAVKPGGLGEIDLSITGPFSKLSVRPILNKQLQSTAKSLLRQFFH